MKISAVSYHSNPNFLGEKKNTSNKLRNTAGAAMIALATAAPMSSEAQIIYPMTTYPQAYYPVPQPSYTYNSNSGSIPDCFIVGDVTKKASKKSMERVFDEIDANGNENGVISAKEVVRTQRKNWNSSHITPYSGAQMQAAERQFETISKLYNEDDSDPYTMTFEEYQEAMEDYVETKKARNFIDLLNVLTLPYIYLPPPHYHYHHSLPPYHDYHRPPHRHDHNPPPVHRHW